MIERSRLLGLLRDAHRRRLTVIHAPAGYGKTTLALQWTEHLAAHGVRVAWLELRPDDNSVVHLLGHLFEALRRAIPTLAESFDRLAETLEQNPADSEQFVCTSLLDELAVFGGPPVVALDDWHLVSDPAVIELIATVVDTAPRNVSVLLTSRALPSLRLSRLRLSEQLTQIGPGLLRFDEQESRQFLLEHSGLSLTSGDLRKLTDSADGWVAALQLASLSLRERPDTDQLIASLSGRHHAIGAYLAENVLDALPTDLEQLLLYTSVTEQLCGALVTALTGRPDGHAALDELVRRDLFLRPLDPEHEWFRYHNLFAEHLRRRLDREYPGMPAKLHRLASAWFAEHDMIGEAVDHALAANDVELAADLVRRHSMPLVEHSRMTSALRLIGRLPTDVVRGDPALQVTLAWANCLLQRAIPAADALDRARSLLSTEPDVDPAMLHEIDVAQACTDVYADRFDRAERLVAPSLVPGVTRPFVGAAAANIQSCADMVAFRFSAALTRQKQTQQLHRKSRGPFVWVYGDCFAGLAALATLDLPTAERHFHAALALGRASAGSTSHAARLPGALIGELHYERGDLDNAAKLLEESREVGAESGVVEFMLAIFGTLARVRAVQGDHGGALALLGDGLEVAERLNLPRLKARMIADKVSLLIETGQTRRALTTAQALPDGSSCHARIATLIEWTRTATLGAVLTADGNHVAAIGLLETLLERTVEAGHPLWEIRARLQLAAAQETGRFFERAGATLAPALRRARVAGLYRTVLDGGPAVHSALRRMAADTRYSEDADDSPVPSEYLARLIGDDAPRIAASADFSAQEVRILGLLERGLSNTQIAQDQSVSVNTVKWYLKNIYAKLGVSNRTQCVFAIRNSR
ncbi:MAG TPA: LuxR C-terminal-related transcriptional regulator [Pseudonocardia sp.]|jgi:LuxR family maltose regulon positive regulatory protein/serine/threonine-protein kinase PknK|nr:LuxR C-terminal-related transcriptional regulator [Pseudonocardia sp.]